MKIIKKYFLYLFSTTLLVGFVFNTPSSNQKEEKNMNKTIKSEKEWKDCLTPEEYKILREKGTEMAFTGKYYKHKEEGVYMCAGCGANLFSSKTKYDSGTGWPSFWEPISAETIKEEVDKSLPFIRTEILCNNCGGHLGHVFNDGPNPTGLRYCINSVSLDFKAKED